MNSPEDEAKIAETRQRVANLVVMSMRPNQSPQQLGLLNDLQRSARAELRLRRKGAQAQPEQPSDQPDPTTPLPNPSQIL